MIRTRFAPAPTGFLHLGHVVNAHYVWEAARSAPGGGEVALRIEDHDRDRSRPEYEQAILDDLDWLGFSPDLVLPRQSGRERAYEAALADLRQKGLVYACECSRADLEPPAAAGAEPRYPGTCAGKHLPERAGLSLRVRLAPSVERFVDRVCGAQAQNPAAQCGDLLVRDRRGNWTYQFCVAVDDYTQGITLVVRGEDLLASTGRQIQLSRLLGRSTPPEFLHHPLVMKTPGQKLSKSDRDTGVRDLRAAGWTPERVRTHALSLVIRHGDAAERSVARGHDACQE